MYRRFEEIEEIAQKLISEEPLLANIKNSDVNIAYIYADKPKRTNGRVIYADCAKSTEKNAALHGFDFVITFYKDCLAMSDQQLELLTYHELRHVGVDGDRYKCLPHDFEDFEDIIRKHGIDWNRTGVE